MDTHLHEIQLDLRYGNEGILKSMEALKNLKTPEMGLMKDGVSLILTMPELHQQNEEAISNSDLQIFHKAFVKNVQLKAVSSYVKSLKLWSDAVPHIISTEWSKVWRQVINKFAHVKVLRIQLSSAKNHYLPEMIGVTLPHLHQFILEGDNFNEDEEEVIGLYTWVISCCQSIKNVKVLDIHAFGDCEKFVNMIKNGALPNLEQLIIPWSVCLLSIRRKLAYLSLSFSLDTPLNEKELIQFLEGQAPVLKCLTIIKKHNRAIAQEFIEKIRSNFPELEVRLREDEEK